MAFDKRELLGEWTSLEACLSSNEPQMRRAWDAVGDDARAFWAAACATSVPGVPTGVGGWRATPLREGLAIEWLAPDGALLGTGNYRHEWSVAKGLEGKENHLLYAVGSDADWPFRWLLATSPVPERAAIARGGRLSRVHFQFASNLTDILTAGTLVQPRWYPTMCANDGDLLDLCRLVRDLCRPPA